MKKASIQRSTTMSIVPCYDGRTLAGVQKVVKDGLSVISIKQSHRNCQYLTDPVTKLPRLSCAEGMKARNSFWNLHKPDLRKVKGLECATSESVTQMLKAHSEHNASKPTYKRKIIRLLGSLVAKRTVSPMQICVLQNETLWPVNTCVLSSVCRETEITQNGIVGTRTHSKTGDSEDLNKDQTTSTTPFKNNKVLVIENENYSSTADSGITLPSTSTTPYDFDFCYENIDNTFNSSNTSDIKITPSYNNGEDFESDNLSNRIQSSPIKLSGLNKKNCSQVKVSISSQLMSIPQSIDSYIGCTDVMGSGNNIIDASLPPLCEKIKSEINSCHEGNNTENEINDVTQSTVDMMQSVFSDMLKDMKDIEDYISAYISSFCILEEEFDNYAAIKSSSDVVSNFLHEMQSSGKDMTVKIPEEAQSESKNKQNTFCAYTTDEKSNFLLEEQAHENFLPESSNQAVSSYCYWEDDDMVEASLEMDSVASKNHSEVIRQENALTKNTALIPLAFFEEVWKLGLEPFYRDKSIDNSLQYESCNDTLFPQYHPSTGLYDPTVLEEAETIVHAFDTFLNGCFYTELGNTYQSMPCTIIELDDDYNEPFSTNGKSNIAIVNHGTKSNHMLSNNQDEWNETTRIAAQSNKTVCSAVNKNDMNDSNSTVDGTNFFNTLNCKIQSSFKTTESSSNMDEVCEPVNNKPNKSSGCDKFIEWTKCNHSFIEETAQIQNPRLNNHEITNKNSEKLQTDNFFTKEQHNYKQNPKIVHFSTVSSPLNVQRTRPCSSEYRGNLSDISVNTLEERTTSELSEKNSHRARSRFVHVQEENKSSSTTNISNYLFSSPNVQLNLTNPLLNEKK